MTTIGSKVATFRRRLTQNSRFFISANRSAASAFAASVALPSRISFQPRRNNASELVRELSADPGLGFGLGKNPQELETETLSALSAAVAMLKEKAPDDADAYKQIVAES